MLDGVNIEELQNWYYSAHGVFTNVPGDYWSALRTVDGGPGSCAGTFLLGSGGAVIANQPLEWGYAWGYSTAYVPNFYLYECWGGIGTPTEETSWGAVRALFR